MKFTLSTVLIASLGASLSSCLPAESKPAEVSIPVPATTVYQVYPPLETNGKPAKVSFGAPLISTLTEVLTTSAEYSVIPTSKNEPLVASISATTRTCILLLLL